MFIGREAELAFLEDRYRDRKGQLVVLYGRRRVGKTETLREFCGGKPHVFFSCTQVPDNAQLERFSRQLLRENLPAGRYVSSFSDWENAFRAMTDLPYGEHKKLVVIDEFPYMCKGNPAIPSILQQLWDEILKDENVMVVLCGSAMSFIEKDILSEKNPLYGRATGIYRMREMGFYDAVKFFPGYSAEDKVLAYAVLGGIPHYLSRFDPSLTLSENIKRHILSKGSVLYSETDFLLHRELRETPVYNSVIEAVALGNTKLNEIASHSLIGSTAKTSVYLKNLIELGIVEREFSVDAGAKEKSNMSRGTYRLADHFFRFWYAFGFPNLSELEYGDVDGVYDYRVAPALHAFASLAFEDVCREFVRKLQKRNALPFRFEKAGRWIGKTTVRDTHAKDGIRLAETEIDLLCIGRNAKEYLVGECKFKKTPFGYAEYLDTAAKLAPQQSSAFYYALFSASGFDRKLISEAQAKGNLFLYDLETIVNSE